MCPVVEILYRAVWCVQFVEVPEIEKEVKRLLRMDNEAVHVRHEVVDEESKLKDESGQPTVASIKEELGT